MIAGLDPGLRNTGLVVVDTNLDVQTSSLIQVEPSAAKRLVDIESAVSTILLHYHPQVEVFIEGYAYGATYQRESLAELGGVLRRFFYLQSMTYWVIPPLTLKQFVTDTTKAPKSYMMRRTKEKWGLSFKSDHICDAYGLARLGIYVMSYINGKDLSETKAEQAVVAEIAHHIGNYQGLNTAKRSPKQRNNARNKTNTKS